MRHLPQLHDRLAYPGLCTLEVIMRAVILAAILSLAALSASAQTATTCKSQADEKKLAGVALKSFTTKCERGGEGSLRCFGEGEEVGGVLLRRASRKSASPTRPALSGARFQD